MNICIATAYDEKYERMGRLCQDSLSRYSSATGIAAVRSALDSRGRPAAWAKIPVILSLLNRGWDYVCWIDADAMFMRFDVDIRSAFDHAKDFSWVAAEVVEARPDAPTVVQPCSGFMVCKNTEWTRRFLKDVWARTEFTLHCWWDLAAFIYMCGYHSAYDDRMFDRGKRELLALVDPDPHRPSSRSDAEILERVGRLDVRWNCTDQSAATAAARPVVRHFTGSNGPFARRLRLMEDASLGTISGDA
jgi:hypothetical protein